MSSDRESFASGSTAPLPVQQPGGTLPSAAQLCGQCVRQAGVTGASVSLMGNRATQITLHATDPVATGLTEALHALHQGPRAEAFERRTVVLADDLTDVRTNEHWPLFARQALHLGVRAVLCFPLLTEGAVAGMLELYRDRPGTLSDAGMRFASGTAEALAIGVLNLGLWLDTASDFDLVVFDDPYEDMAAVHQAIGMMSARLGMNTKQAGARLRAHAFATGRSITSVAQDVLAAHQRQRQQRKEQPR
ncbi:MAG: GAF and ANTAR domain-containing protein [Sciscionella sp.]